MQMTPEELKGATFRGPVRFYDGRKGMAQQDFECVAEPRFGYSWRRESRHDKGRQFYTVDWTEVADLEEAARLLAEPPRSDSGAETHRRSIADFKAAPKLNYAATRAQNMAEMNADAAPFGQVRTWLHRAGNAWHQGINRYSDYERQGGRDFPFWLYRAKDAAHESYRLIYLFEHDLKEDTGLVCVMGTKCRSCPILQSVEAAMIAARDNERWPSPIEDSDIAAAKAWSCITHVLTSGTDPVDGAFLMNKRDRENAADEAERWAAIAAYEDVTTE